MTDVLVSWLTAGQNALEAGAYPAAIDAFSKARDALPGEVALAMALANAYRLSGNLLQTRETLERAHHEGAWTEAATAYDLGAALLEAGAPREALECFTLVVKQRPDDPAALGALAGARRALGQPDVAWPLIEKATAKARNNPALLLTAAQIRHDLRDLTGALRWLDRAEAIRPGHGPTRVQRAYTSLLKQTSAAGWALFESRPLSEPTTAARPWQGEPLDGASILVTAEQGVGDQFQFARFIPLLAARGAARIVVECHADAVSLFAASGFEAVPRGAPPETNWHVPMMSLPFRLQTDADVAGDAVPYLRAPAGLHIPLPSPRSVGVRRLGLVWAGNPAFPGRVTRDLDAALLPEILDIPGVEWIALQHGDDSAARDPRLTRLAPPRDWAATAATLAALDGLVTTDTGIAHLAGAMGVRTWVMLQHVPDWRWGLEGDTSPWYPSMTLLRPARWNDWRRVVERLRHALTDETASPG